MRRRLLGLAVFACFIASAAFADSADLSLVLTGPSSVAPSGSAATVFFSLTLTNSGPSIAQGVVVDFSPGVVPDMPYSFTCANAGDHMRCSAASMAPGTVQGGGGMFLQQPANGTSVSASASVSATTADPDTTNNAGIYNTTIVWQADVRLDPLDVASLIAPGNDVAIDAYYENRGPSYASNATITISMPPHTTYDGGYWESWFHCTEPAIGTRGDLVCTASNLGNIEGDFVELLARVDPDTVPGATLTFDATLTCSDALNPNQSTQGSLTVTPPADAGVSLAAPAEVNPGDTFNATLTATNKGPNPALNVTLIYNIQGGAQVTGVSGPAGWTCRRSLTQASCSVSSFPAGATVTMIFSMLLPQSFRGGPLQETVFLSTISDTNGFDNVVKATIAVSTAMLAPLSLAMTQNPTTAHTGDTIAYTMQLSNTGQVDAQNVSYYFPLPQGLTFVSSNCPVALTSNTCNFGTLAAGTAQSFTINARVDAGAGTTLYLNTFATATNALAPQSGSLTTTISGTPHVDLRAVLSGPAVLRAGDVGVWTVGIKNAGPDVPTEWHLSFHISANATYIVRDDHLAACSAPASGTTGGTIECEGTTILDYENPLIYIVGLSVPVGTSEPIHTTLTISTTNDDPVPSNNTVSADTSITTLASLAASIVTDKTAAVEGEIVTETFVLKNNGPDPATEVAIDASVPSGATVMTPSSTFDSCTGAFHCVATTLAPGGSLTLTVPFRAPQRVGGAESRFSGTAQNSLDAFMTAEILVLAPPPAADLSVSLTGAPATLSVGDLVTYAVNITNAGSLPASNVVLTQSLPSSLAFVSASVNCAGYPTLTCNVGTIAPGNWSAVTITTRALAGGTVSSTSTVSTSSEEAHTSNNTATAMVTINVPAPAPRRRAARH
ncbi:MAG TPA: hypothetical protein VGJ81_22710 [Thermoanaerobaculia bacterium]|jgi:uncharacterized repeat protein (TIGR01451 family)